MVGDIVSSTAAMEADEEHAVRVFAACLNAVAKVVENRDGRVFSSAGDALLAEFASPVNALRAAMEARSSLVSVDGGEHVAMRFGLHLADVFQVGDDLRGEGVNLAARIQGQAEPGEVYVSATMIEQVRRVSPCTFESLGEFDLKGVSEPVPLYRIAGEMERYPFQTAPTRPAAEPKIRPHSVAVVPFRTASSADEDQKFLAEGLTEDLILELSRWRRLFVSSRSATFALDNQDPVEIGRQLGVQFIVSGSVRKTGPVLRLNLTLSDSTTGRTIWSDRLEQDFAEIWEAMDQVTARIAATVFGRIENEEISSARKRPSKSLDAYQFYLRGIEHHRLGQLTNHHVQEAISWFGQAMDADPHFATPVAMQICAASQLPDFDWDWGERQIARALELDPHDPEINRIMGSVRMKAGDFAAARQYHMRAMELSPNDAYIVGRCAAFHVYAGEPERALELLRQAEELDPFLPVWCAEEKVAAYYVMDSWQKALEAARTLPFQTRRTRLYRAASRMAMGDSARAQQLIAEVLAENPDTATDFVEANENYEDEETLALLLDRLRTAGLPNPPAGRTADLPPKMTS
jgi:TolB-like protein/Tfp pilus assembly protein PilF